MFGLHEKIGVPIKNNRGGKKERRGAGGVIHERKISFLY